MFRKTQVKLAQTQPEFDAQATAFLEENDIEVSADTLALFGAAIQHSDQSVDTFVPSEVAAKIRKAIASRLAFYLIHPDKRPKPAEETLAAGEHANELEGQ